MPNPRHPGASRHVLAFALALLLSAGVTVSVSPVLAAESFDEQLREAEQREQAAENELQTLSAEATLIRDELVGIQTRLDDATGTLRLLDGQVSLASQELDEREIRAQEAADAAVAAADELDVIERDLRSQEELLADQLAIAWIHGSTSGPELLYELLRTSSSPSDVAADLYRLETVLDGQAGIVDAVESLRGTQVIAVDQARAARQQADRLRQDAADAVQFIQGLRDQAAAVRADVASDRDRQAALLASIEADADQTRAVLASVQAEQDRIEEERQQVIAAQQEADRKRAEEEAARRAEQEALAAAQSEEPADEAEGGQEPEDNRAGSGSGSGSGTPPSGPCPVDGARAGRDFSNDWGFPRPGGRAHEGTDIFANRGVPVRSVGSGTVKELRYTDTGLGGLYVSIWVAEGEHWYYAHLDSIVPGLAPGVPISDGQQIGTVGNSGNARTTPPHLHIGHYFDDVAENPYPILEGRCR